MHNEGNQRGRPHPFVFIFSGKQHFNVTSKVRDTLMVKTLTVQEPSHINHCNASTAQTQNVI